MGKYIRLSLVVALMSILYSASAQSFKDKIDIKFPDSYSGQLNTTSAVDVYSNPTLALSSYGDGRFRHRVDGGWHYKTLAYGQMDDFSYFIDGFVATGWEKLSSLDKIDFQRVKNAEKTIYYTSIYISQYWDFREIFLSVGSSFGVYDIYINSAKVGSNLDTRNVASFDITPFVEEEYNDLVIICRASKNASKLEDNRTPFPALNGDVYIYSTPKLRIEDFKLNTYFTNGYKYGNLQLDIDIKTHLINSKEAKLLYRLYDMSGKLIDRGSRWTKLKMKDSDKVNFHSLIKNVDKYSVDSPYLYKAVVTLIHENRVTQTISINIPFFKYESSETKFLVNSVDTRLRGVVLDSEGLMSDNTYKDSIISKLSDFKHNGFNAIMLDSPQRSIFYSACDSLGLYVIDMANIDIRNSGSNKEVYGSYANLPASAEAITQRVISQYNRVKHHPSVMALRATRSRANGYSLYEMYMRMINLNIDLPLASNAIDQEWNNDFLVHYPSVDNQLHLSPNKMNFVVAATMQSFNDIIRKDDNITGLFVPESELYKTLKKSDKLKSVYLTVVDSLKGLLVVERKNSAILNKDISFKYKVLANDKLFFEQEIEKDFDKQNRYDIELDYDSLDKAIVAKYKLTQLIKWIKFKIIIEIVALDGVRDVVEFKYKPEINNN